MFLQMWLFRPVKCLCDVILLSHRGQRVCYKRMMYLSMWVYCTKLSNHVMVSGRLANGFSRVSIYLSQFSALSFLPGYDFALKMLDHIAPWIRKLIYPLLCLFNVDYFGYFLLSFTLEIHYNISCMPPNRQSWL